MRATKSADQTIANGIFTVLTFDQEVYDTDDFHDNSTNPSRFSITEDGWYSMSTSIRWNSDGSSGRLVMIGKNGDYGICGRLTLANINTQQQVGCIDYLEVGDYIEVFVIHITGSSKNVLGGDPTNFSLSKIKNSTATAASSHISADLSLSDNTWTEITWNDEVSDTDALHNSPSTQFTANSDGWYYVGLGVAWDASTTGQRATRIMVNDSTTIAMGEQVAANASVSHISAIVLLNSGDYVEASAKQTSGGLFDLNSTVTFGGPESYKTRFDFIKISDP